MFALLLTEAKIRPQKLKIMATIATIGLNKEKLVFNEKGYCNITVVLNDEVNAYGQNVAVTLNQTKEQREAKEAKTYVGNGKVVWTDGTAPSVAPRQESSVASSQQSTAGRATPDLPF